MSRNLHLSTRVLLAGLAVSALGYRSAQAVSYDWAAAGSGDFNDSSKWTPTGFPVAGDIANFNTGGASTVNFPAAAASDQLFVKGTDAVVFTLGGNTYNINTAASGYNTQIGTTAADNASLTVQNGSINAYDPAYVLQQGTQVGGPSSTGALIIESGAGYSYNNMYLDGAGSVLTVDGATSTLFGGPGSFYQGNGTFTVKNGAQVSIANYAQAGASIATVVTGTGSKVTDYAGVNRMIGAGGTTDIVAGATWDALANQFEMGVFSGGPGVVTVGNGVGASKILADDFLWGTGFDANRGTPELRIAAGGSVEASSTSQAMFIYDRGTFTLDGGVAKVGPGSAVKVANLNDTTTPRGTLRGNGTIQLLSAGSNFTITNDGDIRPGDTSATPAIGTLNIADGDLVQNTFSSTSIAGPTVSGGTIYFNVTSGNSSDLITITNGSATLAGSFDFSVLGGYTPMEGDYWTLLTADTVDITGSTNNAVSAMAAAGYAGPVFFGVVGGPGGTQQLVLALPEPTSVSLLALGGGLLLRRKRKLA